MHHNHHHLHLLLLLLLLPWLMHRAAAVRIVEITDTNVARMIGTKSLTTVLFYSAGCKSCTDILNIMHKISIKLGKSHKEMKFGRIEIQQQPLLSMRYHADEVPQVKVFAHSSTPITFHGEVTEERLVKFLRGLRMQSSVKSRLAEAGEQLFGGMSLHSATDRSVHAVELDGQESVSDVQSVNSSTYESIVLSNDTNVLLALHTKDCGGACKEFAKIARVFRHDSHHIVFASIDVDANPIFARHFRTNSNPTLLWFPRNDKNNIVRYGGDVDIQELVGFINDMTGTRRETDGSLEAGGGRIEEFERLISAKATDLVLGRNLPHIIHEAEQTLQHLPHSTRNTDLYMRILYEINKGKSIDKVLEDENSRITRRLKSAASSSSSSSSKSKLQAGEHDSLLQQHNIVTGITNIVVQLLQEERLAAEDAAAAKRRQREKEAMQLKQQQQQQQDLEGKSETTAARISSREEL